MLFSSTTTTTLPVKANSVPEITLDPNWGWYDTTIHIHGTGFPASEEVVISWESLNHWRVFTSTNSLGIFDSWFNVPDGLIAGDYVVSAIDEYGNTASDTFTLYYVYVDGEFFGIKTPKQYIQWKYDKDEFYCDFWQFYHDSYDNWYPIMYHDYGIYILRLTYNGLTYLFDLGSRRLTGGRFNAWPEPLVEKVVGFEVKDIDHVQGTILLYDPTGSVLLVTTLVDIYVPINAADYYAVIFTMTAEAELDDLAFYVAYNLDVYTDCPNWAYYESDLDAVYQYYGPSYYWPDIPEKRKCYAGFGSVIPASAHHDAVVSCDYVQFVADNLLDYDFNYRDRGVAYGDYYSAWGRDCGVGLQWTVGPLGVGDDATIPVAFAVSDETFDAFKASLKEGKIFAYGLMLQPPAITLLPIKGVGFSMVSISGEGFMPYAQVDVYFGNVSVVSYIADSEGGIEGSFVVPVVETGDYVVVAIDEYGLRAEAVFTVTMYLDDLAEAIAHLELKLDELAELVADIAEELSLTHEDLAELIGNIYDDLGLKIDDLAGLIDALTSGGEYSLSDIASLIGELEGKLDLTMEDLANLIGDVADNHEELVGLISDIEDIVGLTRDNLADLIEAVADNQEELVELIEDLGSDMSLSDLAELINALSDDHEELVDLISDLEEKLDLTMDDLADLIRDVAENHEELIELVADLEDKLDLTLEDLADLLEAVADSQEELVEFVEALASDMSLSDLAELIDALEVKLDDIVIPLLERINATVIGVDVKVDGYYVLLNTKIGEMELKLDDTVIPFLQAINTTVVGIRDDLILMNTTIGEIEVKLDESVVPLLEGINANIVDIQSNMVTLNSTLGQIQLDLDAVRLELVSVQGDIEEGLATVAAAIVDAEDNVMAELGNVTLSLADINMEVEAVSGDVVDLKSDIGTIKGMIESIQGDIVTIRTDVGTITTTTGAIKGETGLQPVTIALSSIAAISAVACAVLILRKIYK